MKKAILGVALVAAVASISLAGGKDKDKAKASCCKEKATASAGCCKDKAAKAEGKEASKCCHDMEKAAKTDKKATKKAA